MADGVVDDCPGGGVAHHPRRPAAPREGHSVRSLGIRVDAVHVAVEVGKVIDPVNFEAQVQGGVLWGLGHAMFAELTHAGGRVEQSNFHDYTSLRLYQTPRIEVRTFETTGEVRGIGEPPVPPVAPALANAIFAATGQRIRELPLVKQIGFV